MDPFIEETSVSCGLFQIGGVHDLKESEFVAFVNKNKVRMYQWDDDDSNIYIRPVKGYQYVFSDNTKGHGKNVAEWITKYKLGTVICSGRPRVNPNSGEKIQVWVWKYNGRKPVLDSGVKNAA